MPDILNAYAIDGVALDEAGLVEVLEYQLRGIWQQRQMANAQIAEAERIKSIWPKPIKGVKNG